MKNRKGLSIKSSLWEHISKLCLLTIMPCHGSPSCSIASCGNCVCVTLSVSPGGVHVPQIESCHLFLSDFSLYIPQIQVFPTAGEEYWDYWGEICGVEELCFCSQRGCCGLMSMTRTEIEHFDVLGLRKPMQVVQTLGRDHSCEC